MLDFFPWRDVVFPFVSFEVDSDAGGDPVRLSDVWQSFVAGGCCVEIELGTEVEDCVAETTDGTEMKNERGAETEAEMEEVEEDE